jgi:hypothetical protein
MFIGDKERAEFQRYLAVELATGHQDASRSLLARMRDRQERKVSPSTGAPYTIADEDRLERALFAAWRQFIHCHDTKGRDKFFIALGEMDVRAFDGIIMVMQSARFAEVVKQLHRGSHGDSDHGSHHDTKSGGGADH